MNHVLILLGTAFAASFSCKFNNWNPSLNHHVAALVLARGGSKGIPLKNLAKIGNRSLLNITLGTVLKVDFSSVWVSTDHEEILKEAGSVNAHWRSEESATDEAPSILGVLDFVGAHPEVDIVALVQCTSPFSKTRYLKEALEWIRRGAECVFSVNRSYNLRWLEKENGTVSPINFNPKSRPRRQDWGGELTENGMFYFARTALVKRGFLQSERYSMSNALCDLKLGLCARKNYQNMRVRWSAKQMVWIKLEKN